MTAIKDIIGWPEIGLVTALIQDNSQIISHLNLNYDNVTIFDNPTSKTIEVPNAELFVIYLYEGENQNAVIITKSIADINPLCGGYLMFAYQKKFTNEQMI